MAECPNCKGSRWVCDDHPLAAWDEGCEIEGCGGAGVPCRCNPDAQMPPGFRAIVSRDPRDLTDADLDAIYVFVNKKIPRITRAILPVILEQQIARGVIELTITSEEVSVRMPKAPQFGVYRVKRKRTLH